jgi:hypothetical protein
VLPKGANYVRAKALEAEFSEMRMHGPKIANDVSEIIADVRRNALAAAR